MTLKAHGTRQLIQQMRAMSPNKEALTTTYGSLIVLKNGLTLLKKGRPMRLISIDLILHCWN